MLWLRTQPLCTHGNRPDPVSTLDHPHRPCHRHHGRERVGSWGSHKPLCPFSLCFSSSRANLRRHRPTEAGHLDSVGELHTSHLDKGLECSTHWPTSRRNCSLKKQEQNSQHVYWILLTPRQRYPSPPCRVSGQRPMPQHTLGTTVQGHSLDPPVSASHTPGHPR